MPCLGDIVVESPERKEYTSGTDSRDAGKRRRHSGLFAGRQQVPAVEIAGCSARELAVRLQLENEAHTAVPELDRLVNGVLVTEPSARKKLSITSLLPLAVSGRTDRQIPGRPPGTAAAARC